jgi:hypothetical protein
MLGHDRLLPRLELDWALVLAAWAMLGEQARPLLGVRGHHDGAAGERRNANPARRHDDPHPLDAPADDLRISIVEHDPQLEHAAPMRGDATVPQVKAQKVRVVTAETAEVMRIVPAGSTDVGVRHPAAGSAVTSAPPVPDSTPRDVDHAGDLGIA